jgi:5'-nucleotidase
MTEVRKGSDAGAGAWILVTNDDGIETPALSPLLGALRSVARVRAVVPTQEYSWSSKILSRFGRLRLTDIEGTGGEALTGLDGSPADCANVGIHNLDRQAPRLVVSGINIGANAGLAFLLSSGTVGAAIEATLNGVPAVAFSVQLAPDHYARWRDERCTGLSLKTWENAAAVAAEITEEVWRAGLPEGADLLSVNLPAGAHPGTTRVLTQVARTIYGPFFRVAGDGCLEHEYSGLQRADSTGNSDLDALERGEVSITPLRLDLDVGLTAVDRARFERC